MIEVENVSKTFGDVTAVQDVSFTARDGQVTGLLGPNGAGKSTTLRVIYGVIRPTKGSANVDGINVTEDPLDAQRRMGILPDRVGLYSRLTAREHLRYFGRLQHLEGETIEARIDELVRLLDMQDIADRRAEGYSQGERMKVCLGRALLHEPGNMLLDEPTNGLDVMTTRTVRELIGELKRRSVNVLFSSHLMHEVARLCDHIVIVAQGTVVASGTTEEIRATAEDDNLEEAFVKLVERSYLT